MKLATVLYQGKVQVGVVDEATQSWRAVLLQGEPVSDLNQVIRSGQHAESVSFSLSDASLALSAVKLLAPMAKPHRNIMCIGMNYRAHVAEFLGAQDPMAQTGPRAPIVFTKMPETVVGPGAAVRYPHGVTQQLDYEAELAVVIGRGGRDIAIDDAMAHVFGYTIVNDITARDVQSAHQQWFLGKSMDTFCPMGPYVVTADEVDAQNLRVQCWVNGDLRQDGCTADLIFSIPRLISDLSRGMTLLPGDIIATGTPSGVGMSFNPPRFLVPGDRVDIDITGLGRLSNVIT